MKPLFIDVDSQNDFVLPAGALYVPGADRTVSTIAKLNRHAAGQGFPLVSTACLHAENDQEFEIWPPHCVAGTVGQLKPASLMVGQTLFEKQHTDVFLDSRWLPYLREIGASEYFVYGVVTEVCVRFAVNGLLRLGTPVTVITDGIQALNEEAGNQFLRSLADNGGRIIRSDELLSRS